MKLEVPPMTGLSGELKQIYNLASPRRKKAFYPRLVFFHL
jgi:hypothetical protein